MSEYLGTCSYSPEDNKLRFYPFHRLSAEDYARIKAAGFSWAPRQELFVAGMWTPGREDLLIEWCGEIGDEDTTLVDRAEDRAERFEDYSEKRAGDAESARAAVARIADGIPLGQPILVGHHSERHARKDAERIETGMRKAVKMWETSKYWEQRAKGAIRHAKYKERPDVRARRIKGIEADLRKVQKNKTEAQRAVRIWEKLHEPGYLKREDGTPLTFQEAARYIAGHTNTSTMDVYLGLDKGTMTPEEAQETTLRISRTCVEHCDRWAAHYTNRLTYERAMLADVGGTIADKTGPEVGGGCKCWASPGYGRGWSYIQKVNKVSVTVLDNWGNGGGNFTRTIPFDKLSGVMTRAQVDAAREAGTLKESPRKTGFYIVEGGPDPSKETHAEQNERLHREHIAATEAKTEAAPFDAMKESLKAGVKVVSVPHLFPTPPEVAARMVDLCKIADSDEFEVLEPSAGTGRLLDALLDRRERGASRLRIFAIELNHGLCEALSTKYAAPEDAAKGMCRNVLQGDFLEIMPGQLNRFDRIVMNPPFENGSDIKHIQHARRMLKPGGRLVALCANGPRQQEALKPLAGHWEDLPAGSFKEQGTGVNVALLVIDEPEKIGTLL